MAGRGYGMPAEGVDLDWNKMQSLCPSTIATCPQCDGSDLSIRFHAHQGPTDPHPIIVRCAMRCDGCGHLSIGPVVP